jgi:ATP:cob(I)alamin adenosyltransferase
LWLLHTYFIIGSACNDPENNHPEYRKADLSARHLQRLEAEQARIEDRVKLPRQFIVCASNVAAAQMDVTTTIARRFERALVRLKEAYPALDTTTLFPFANRLSDTLYMIARYLEDGSHQTVDYSIL